MNDWMRSLLVPFYQQTVQALPKVVVGLIIFIAFLVTSRILSIVILRSFQRTRVDQNLISLLIQTVSIVIVILGGVTALGTIGVNVGALIAGLGLSGFALSFALKDALANILAGISILLYRPFHVGDYISVTGLEGQVVSIELRYTTLKTKKNKILVPNANLFTNPVSVQIQED